jgi:hypothetical protein
LSPIFPILVSVKLNSSFLALNWIQTNKHILYQFRQFANSIVRFRSKKAVNKNFLNFFICFQNNIFRTSIYFGESPVLSFEFMIFTSFLFYFLQKVLKILFILKFFSILLLFKDFIIENFLFEKIANSQ